MHTLAVHPDFLRAGVGRALLAFAESLARERHMRALRLDVYEKNAPAIHLYERCGYVYAGTADLGLGAYGLDAFRLYERIL